MEPSRSRGPTSRSVCARRCASNAPTERARQIAQELLQTDRDQARPAAARHRLRVAAERPAERQGRGGRRTDKPLHAAHVGCRRADRWQRQAGGAGALRSSESEAGPAGDRAAMLVPPGDYRCVSQPPMGAAVSATAASSSPPNCVRPVRCDLSGLVLGLSRGGFVCGDAVQGARAHGHRLSRVCRSHARTASVGGVQTSPGPSTARPSCRCLARSPRQGITTPPLRRFPSARSRPATTSYEVDCGGGWGPSTRVERSRESGRVVAGVGRLPIRAPRCSRHQGAFSSEWLVDGRST